MEGLFIRKLDKDDLTEAMALVWRVFEEFEAPEYPAEGVETFKDYIEYNAILTRMEAGEITLWGCLHADKIVGVIALRGGYNHISMLFVQKEYHGKGIAKSLLQAALEYARQHAKIETITVNSSPYAVKIYEKMGFAALDKQQMMDGIIYTPMRRML